MKKITTHQYTYTHLQTTHTQLQNKSQNPLAVDYPATHPTSTFSTNTRAYTTMHENIVVTSKNYNSHPQKSILNTEVETLSGLNHLMINVYLPI